MVVMIVMLWSLLIYIYITTMNTWIQQLLIERYLPLIDGTVSSAITYSVDIFNRYVQYNIIMNSLYFVLCIIFMIMTYKAFAMVYKSEKEKGSDTEPFILFLWFVILLFTFFISLGIFSSLVEFIVIPESATYKSLTQNHE